jgi:hypothetical protein
MVELEICMPVFWLVRLMLMFLRRKPSVLFAFVVMLFIWLPVSHLRSDCIVTPRHLALSAWILPEHALTLIPNATNTLTTQTAIILSMNYTKLEQPPPEHWRVTLLSHSNQLFQSLTISSSLIHVHSSSLNLKVFFFLLWRTDRRTEIKQYTPLPLQGAGV